VFYGIDNLQELFTTWQRELLWAHWHALQFFCRIAVYNSCFFCHLENMPEARKRVVVPCRARNLTKRTRPLFTIRFGDAPNFSIRQALPAFQESGKNLISIVPRCRFNRHIIGLILLMDFERLAKGHFGRDFAITVGHALTMFFEKFRELGFGDAIVRCFERFPNFFAASERSGIISPGLMPEKVSMSSSSPRFRRFAQFHKVDRRIAP
jgi:hypothetical protein